MDEIIKEIQDMLEESVEYWRDSTKPYARYYIDAYRSAQLNVEAILSSKQSKSDETDESISLD